MTIERHFNFLTDNVEPRYGLLNKVLSKKILPWRTIDEIKIARTAERQNEQLLTEISAHGKDEQFLKVLTEETHNQQHVVNYVNTDGGIFTVLRPQTPEA